MNMLELKQCLIRILDRAEKNAKEGQLNSQDEFDLNDCLKQIKRELKEIQWSNNRRSRISPIESKAFFNRRQQPRRPSGGPDFLEKEKI